MNTKESIQKRVTELVSAAALRTSPWLPVVDDPDHEAQIEAFKIENSVKPSDQTRFKCSATGAFVDAFGSSANGLHGVEGRTRPTPVR